DRDRAARPPGRAGHSRFFVRPRAVDQFGAAGLAGSAGFAGAVFGASGFLASAGFGATAFATSPGFEDAGTPSFAAAPGLAASPPFPPGPIVTGSGGVGGSAFVISRSSMSKISVAPPGLFGGRP